MSPRRIRSSTFGRSPSATLWITPTSRPWSPTTLAAPSVPRRVHLEDEDLLVPDRELNVDEADDAQLLRERLRLGPQRVDLIVPERVRRERARRVARVHAGFLDMLHHAADRDDPAVSDRVDVDLERVLEELVDEHRMVGRHPHRLAHVRF